MKKKTEKRIRFAMAFAGLVVGLVLTHEDKSQMSYIIGLIIVFCATVRLFTS